ncbi:lasso peptide biosynthesis B2 protein [Brevundimonas sp.]|uniref:lasso peptide biosynthesis B2 protein n=1 Tax=Brevundimonas sp. TaxID=1871086 RepID=UPI0035640979
MSKQLWPAEGVFLACVDDDVIVLNLAADRYDGLLDAGDRIRLDDNGALHIVDADIAAELIAGRIATAAQPLSRNPRPVAARRELQSDPAPAGRDVLRAAISLLTATLRFRGRSLLSLVTFRHRLSDPDAVSEARLGELVGAARVARPWIPFEGECLQRSFLLRAHLAAQGVATDWIFGVATWPFAAHCWLQIGDLVVGDRLSRVSRFTPIMRV